MNKSWKEAQNRLAGGVNSPVRAFKAVGGHPIFMKSGKGAYLTDAANHKYVDLCLSWGALLLGHADPATIQAVKLQAEMGTSFGTATEMETTLAKQIQKAFPRIERLRFTSSGTEAVMSAVRVARGATDRKKILKFEGCYHGHADSLLVKAGSGLATFGSPDSSGVPAEIASLTAVLPYNDEKSLENFFKKNKDLACVIVEPIAANMGVVPGKKDFLSALRYWTKKTGAILIFDEVISGFRVAYGGAQHLYKITPDLTILGKIIGGGLPVGAFGGSAKIMNHLSPLGSVYQAGTLSGNPLSMKAGESVLSRLSPNFYNQLEKKSAHFEQKLKQIFANKKKAASITRIGSMFTVFYRESAPQNFTQVCDSDTNMFRRVFHGLLKKGIYTPPSAFEASFLSSSHGQTEILKVLGAFEAI